MATAGNSSGCSGESVLSEELYLAAISVYESIRWIQVQEDKMAEISAVRNNLLGLKSDIFKLFEKISRQSDSDTQKRICAMQNACHDLKSLETQSKIGDGGEIEMRCEESKPRSAASLELEDLLHRAAVQTQMWIGEDAESEELLDLVARETQGRIVGQADNLSSLPKFTSEIMSKFREVAGDIAIVFEAQQNRKEALAVLSFGFRLQLLSKQIDELWREMCKLLRAFSPENKDVMRTMIMFTCEPYLRRICELQWISERISMLQRMDSDFDSKVKSMIIELKSESFLSAMEKLKEESRRQGCGDQKVSMEMEEKRFTAYRLYWERTWGNTNSFEAQTILSPMLFTHCTPSRIPVEAAAGSTLQIYSVKISLTDKILFRDKISFPLEVYGVVAARDAVDRCRNPIFLRRRNFCQILTEQDPFLRLTGPVRAIVSIETVYIEIQLRVKGVTKSEDRALISAFYFYNGDSSPQVAKNSFCTVELCNEQLKQSVQATILSVHVTAEAGSLPFPHGGRVVCSSLPQDVDKDIAGQVVILDLEGGMAKAGYLDLSRHVVSVELDGQLKVLMEAYTPSQSVESTHALFITPQKWNISKHKCNFGSYQVGITIAWSLITSKTLS
ncbi:uncharacterized protein LOC123430973 [Hordeum vulgare subsp. vulgare]|uniref:Predicted protein n=1 Tax=Hordeum vulgare subsp. vulgare TaxID=112509 RepID=F2ELU6_HORVV|nr:uncharacterized protein LOC123430971 [Hordeum vulgare subsp. vulgare]XP_044970732.1 uncharacterized protein LOC123430973 [Hordeum vulgare subsp. vulgare]KAI5010498.1 hypothetical protein ZWY2020_012635 [Hordeum vulgare]BAK08318.1 predicted protein [Hordeum vulgare subsp. vulgare]